VLAGDDAAHGGLFFEAVDGPQVAGFGGQVVGRQHLVSSCAQRRDAYPPQHTRSASEQDLRRRRTSAVAGRFGDQHGLAGFGDVTDEDLRRRPSVVASVDVQVLARLKPVLARLEPP
jgi:hypothetical protein